MADTHNITDIEHIYIFIDFQKLCVGKSTFTMLTIWAQRLAGLHTFRQQRKPSSIYSISPKTLCKNLFFPPSSLHHRLVNIVPVPESTATISKSVSAVSVGLVEATVIEGPGDGGFVVGCGEAKSTGALVLVLQPPTEE